MKKILLLSLLAVFVASCGSTLEYWKGSRKIPFFAANNWTGVDNLIATYTFENNGNDTSNNLQHLTHTSVQYDSINEMEGSYSYEGDGTLRYFTRTNASLSSDFPGKASSDMTVLFWYRPDQVESEKYIAGVWSYTGRNSSWLLGHRNRFYFAIGNGARGGWYSAVTSATLEVDKLYHVAATLDNSTRIVSIEVWNETDQEYVLSDEGHEVDHDYGNNALVATSSNFVVGGKWTLDATQSVDGTLDELIIFNRVLSRYDIKRIREGTFSSADVVPQWGLFEKRLTSTNSYTNAQKYGTVTLSAVFTGPTESYTIQGFWDGGNDWKIRFMPTEAGFWSYVINSADSQLNNASNDGSFTAVAPTLAEIEANANLRGRIEIHSNNRKFQYADGTPFFWMGNTMWAANSYKCGFTDFKSYIADNKDKGFNLLQVMVTRPNNRGYAIGETDPGGDTWTRVRSRQRDLGNGGYAFVGEKNVDPMGGSQDWTEINPYRFQIWDTRMQYLWEQGIVPVLFANWGRDWSDIANKTFDPINDKPDFWNALTAAEYEDYFRYLFARYGAYNMIFYGSGEYRTFNAFYNYDCSTDPDPGNIITKMDTAMTYADGIDTWGHLMSMHPFVYGYCNYYTSRTDFENELWHDFATMQHSQTMSSYESRITLNYNDTPTMPLVMGETEYEIGIDIGEGSDDDVRQRAWISYFLGCAGHTYGSNGGWAANFDGWATIDMGPTFETIAETLAYEGYNDFPWIKNFFGQVDWLNMVPDSSITTQGYGMQNNSGEYIFYDTDAGTFDVTLPADDHTYKWMNPLTGVWTSPVQFYHSGGTRSFTAPYAEWALLIDGATLLDTGETIDEQPVF
jgi:hypothetical protein